MMELHVMYLPVYGTSRDTATYSKRRLISPSCLHPEGRLGGQHFLQSIIDFSIFGAITCLCSESICQWNWVVSQGFRRNMDVNEVMTPREDD